jgi:integrase
MARLASASKDYLKLRRSLGFQLRGYDGRLADFVAFMNRRNASHTTVKLAMCWAVLNPKLAPMEQARRLSIVRGFARYYHGLDPRTEVPPTGLLRGYKHRRQPYLYTDEEISDLMGAARRLPSAAPTAPPGLRAATYETLIGLLAVTGVRITEALHLDRFDIDWVEKTLTIRETKWRKSRLVPIDPTTILALRQYSQQRDEGYPKPKTTRFLVHERGGPLGYSGVRRTFLQLSRETGLRGPNDRRGPRLHDFRHRRAVQALVRWYREGCDIEQLLPVLSTYLGHVKVSDTYWYMTAIPELLQLAMERVEHAQRRQR